MDDDAEQDGTPGIDLRAVDDSFGAARDETEPMLQRGTSARDRHLRRVQDR